MEETITMEKLSFAEDIVMNDDKKRCTKCNKVKNIQEDFYTYNGCYRGECKDCFKNRSILNKKKSEKLEKLQQGDNYVPYITKYSAKNREKVLQYRKKFKERNPTYARDWQRRKALLTKTKKAEQ